MGFVRGRFTRTMCILSFLTATAWAKDALSAQLTLSWTDTASNEDGFKVERKPGTTGTFAQIAAIGANAGSYVDASLTGGGTYCYRVRAYNTAGDSAYTSEACGTASADTQVPTVSLSSPASGATVSSATVSVTATASDNVGVVGVQFKLDGANLGSEDTTAPYSLIWDTTTVANGAHTLTAVARDAASNSATSTAITVTVNNPPPPPPDPTGLVAAYGLNETSGTTTADASGQGNTGVFTNGPTWTTGQFGGAVNLDGLDDFIAIPDANGLDLGGSGSMEAWVKLDTLNRWHSLFAKGNANNDVAHNYALEVTDTNVIRCILGNGSASLKLDSSVAPTVGQFTHLACTWDGATVRLYLNGALHQSASQTLTPAGNTAPLFLGQFGGNSDRLDGVLDNVRLYSRALSATEVQSNMNIGVGTPPPPPVTYMLTVIKAGTGSGAVTATGVNCGSDCTEAYPTNTVVTLTATPTTGSIFTGWSGDADCSDGSVTMSAAKTCTATFALQSYALTVTKAGTGSGAVTSAPTGIDCGTTCTQSYTYNTQITLTATPAADSSFAGWSGDADCADGSVTMSAAKSCTATFTLHSYGLTVTRTGAGSGTVSGAGIDCGADCSESYASGTVITLTATPAVGSAFTGWSGEVDCSDGSVIMTADKTCTAAFSLLPPPALSLTVNKTGTGSGTISSSPAGINCGADCSESYVSGTTVTLTATPAAGSTFSGWSGDADCADGVVTMSIAKTCIASFQGMGMRIGVYRPSTGEWFLDLNGNGLVDDCDEDRCVSAFGSADELPVVGDWDGTNATRLGLFNKATRLWKLDRNADDAWEAGVDIQVGPFGRAGDVAVVGDWDGSGITKLGVKRPTQSRWELDRNGNGVFDGCTVDLCGSLGGTVKPVVGDWNGFSDGSTKDLIGFFQPGTTTQWRLDLNGNYAWNSGADLQIKAFGQNGDLPVVGDWDSSGTTKIGIFDPATGLWELDTNGNGKWDGCAIDICLGPFGQPGDLPVVGKW